VSASGYFISAAIVLLLGTVALPIALTAYGLASGNRDPMSIATGIWAGFVMVVAIVGPVALTIAGLLSLVRRQDD